ncbi:hypothetical protein ACU8OS_35340 (plasmid) [Rhizobium leguminosarum]
MKAGLIAPLIALGGAEPANAIAPMVIIAAIGLFVSILQSQRGDGGTGAILGAINGKVDVIISQLAAVQLALAQITAQIAQMKEEVLKAIGQQYAIELFNQTKTGLLAITDVQREAENKGISLASGNERHGLEKRLEDAWKEFDQSRRRLREYEQGRGLIAAALVDAMVLADHAAFAAGIIDETQFAIILGRHLDWLDAMVDPSLEFSVAKFASDSKENEAAEREAIRTAARSPNDAVGIISALLLRAQSVEICAITTLDVKYWTELPFPGWEWLRGNDYLMASTYSVERVDQNGATLYAKTFYDQNYQARLRLGNSHVVWQTPDISTVDIDKCRRFSNGELQLLYEDSVRGKFLYESASSTRFDQGISGYISNNFITKSFFARAISTDGRKTAAAVQLLLDKVNLQILNRRLAQLGLETIDGNRRFAESLAAALPTIKRGQP